MMRNHSPACRALTRGFTIVEFMVAVAIGLIISLVIGQVFVGARQSFTSQDDAARIQENMRYATQVLTRTIRMAGYRNNTGQDPNSLFPKTTTPAITGADNVATSGLPSGSNPSAPTAPTVPSAGVVPDTITVRYQGMGTGVTPPTTADGSVVDCFGNSIDYGVTAVSSFAIRPVTKPDGTLSSSLFCSTDGGTTWPAANELIADVDNLQILYGVDTDNDGAANAYVRINNVADIDTIVSVRIWLLMRSPTASNPGASTIIYNLAGVPYTYTDRFVRRVLQTTINLRNRTI